MENGLAHATGRFKPAGESNIFKWREENLSRFQPQPSLQIVNS
jgi:hypothetical protein